MEFLQNMARKNSSVANELMKPTVGTAKIMSTADDIALWYEAVQLYEAGLVDEALEVFTTKVKQNAKMIINTGCCYLRKNDLKTAADIFEKAVTQDKHMALGYYYLGLTQFFLTNYIEAMENFEKTFSLLRGNKFVDYRQLGYNYQLFACEVLTNIAVASLRLEKVEKAKDHLKQANEMRTEKKHERIVELQQNLEDGKLFQPFVPPQSEIFRPSKSAVANIKQKNYLGTSKVISTDSETDCYACFSGIKDKVIEKKAEERRRSSAQGTDLLNHNDRKASDARRKSSTLPPLFPVAMNVQLDVVDGSPTLERKITPPRQPLPVGPNSPKMGRRQGRQENEDQTSGFVENNDLRNRRASTVKPNKPLPKLGAASKSFDASTGFDHDIPEFRKSSVPVLNYEPPTPQGGEVEVNVVFTFRKKIRVPRQCTLNDLHDAAIKQAVPDKLEFRVSDSLGRQSMVTEERLVQLNADLSNNNSDTTIQCFPAP